MSRTTFSGPVKAGDIRNNAYKNVGTVVLAQTVVFDFAAGDVVGAAPYKTIYVPAGSKLNEIYIDVVTAYNGTTPTLSVGKAAAGVEYVSAAAIATDNTRVEGVPATVLNWLNTTTAGGDVSAATTESFPVSPLVISLALSAPASAGSLVVLVQYTQPDDRSTYLTE
jgi:hypothetical protein